MLNVITFSCTGARADEVADVAPGDVGLLPPHAVNAVHTDVRKPQSRRGKLIEGKSFPCGCSVLVLLGGIDMKISKCVAASPSGK
jgi:hypothetical protein